MDFDSQFKKEFSGGGHEFRIISEPRRKKQKVAMHPEIYEASVVVRKPKDSHSAAAFNRTNVNHDHMHTSPWDMAKIDIHKHPRPNFNILDTFDFYDRMRESVEGVPRTYEDKYLVPPRGDQRPCVMEEECEGRFIPGAGSDGFTLREFLLPSQEKAYETTNRYPLVRSPCIMCKRLQIARTVLTARASGMGLAEDVLVQDYYNFVDIDGEYPLETCLLSKKNVWEGLVNPVVLHVRNAYKLEKKDGKKRYTQWKIPFLSNPPGTASALSGTSTTPSSH